MSVPALALALGLTFCPPTGPAATGAAVMAGPRVAAAADSLRELYARGVTFDAFFAKADQRRGLWEEHEARARLDDAFRRRAAAVPGSWRLLVVTVPGCSDTIGSLPYLARLADAVPAIELRIADAAIGGFVLERHRAPDGRQATPTVLLLDADYRLRGCWIERSAELDAWWREHDRPDAPLDERLRIKMGWYAADAGRSTLEMTLSILEAAAAGRTICPGAEPVQ